MKHDEMEVLTVQRVLRTAHVEQSASSHRDGVATREARTEELASADLPGYPEHRLVLLLGENDAGGVFLGRL